MSLLQPLFSTPKLIMAIARKKKYQLEQFEPFSIQLENLYANEKQMSRFTKMFGEPDDIPTFAFITAFRASLQCLAQAKTPSSIMGLIHLSSEFQPYNKINWLTPLNIKVTLSKCEQMDKGLLYTVVTDFYQKGKLVLTNSNCMLDKSRKYRADESPNSDKSHTDLPQNLPELTNIANWHIEQKTAWSYALASGDVNPIHLHPILAKQFGLANVLIHGMYNVSKTLEQLKSHNIEFEQGFKVEFNRPCFIPNNVKLQQYEGSDEFGLFSVSGEDRFLKLTLLSKD